MLLVSTFNIEMTVQCTKALAVREVQGRPEPQKSSTNSLQKPPFKCENCLFKCSFIEDLKSL